MPTWQIVTTGLPGPQGELTALPQTPQQGYDFAAEKGGQERDKGEG